VTPRSSLVFDRQRIVVADEETDAVAFIIDTLRHDGHCVCHAADALSGTSDVALHDCHLLITGTRVEGVVRIDLIDELRERLPALPVLYLANANWFTPEVEAHYPPASRSSASRSRPGSCGPLCGRSSRSCVSGRSWH
jgi:DNA-binding NtrC family response regulator